MAEVNTCVKYTKQKNNLLENELRIDTKQISLDWMVLNLIINLANDMDFYETIFFNRFSLSLSFMNFPSFQL